MLTEQRGRCDALVLSFDPHRPAQQPHVPGCRVLNIADQAEMSDARVGEDLIEAVDRPGRHIGCVQHAEPFCTRCGTESRREDLLEFLVMGNPGAAVCEARVVAQFRAADRLGQPVPELGRRG